MRPLFIFPTVETNKKSLTVLEEKVEEVLIPDLKKMGYNCEMHTIKEISEGVTLKISANRNTILCVPWIRSYLLGQSKEKILSDYPRIAIPSYIKVIQNHEEKVKAMLTMVNKFQLYFLIVIFGPDSKLYWLAQYKDIPVEYWKLTYRNKKEKLDRIHFPGYSKYNFVSFDVLKKQIKKILYE